MTTDDRPLSDRIHGTYTRLYPKSDITLGASEGVSGGPMLFQKNAFTISVSADLLEEIAALAPFHRQVNDEMLSAIEEMRYRDAGIAPVYVLNVPPDEAARLLEEAERATRALEFEVKTIREQIEASQRAMRRILGFAVAELDNAEEDLLAAIGHVCDGW